MRSRPSKAALAAARRLHAPLNGDGPNGQQRLPGVPYLDAAIRKGAKCVCSECLAPLGITVPPTREPTHDSKAGSRALVLKEGKVVPVREAR